MSKHPIEIDGYDTLDELAKAVGKLRYDKLAEFFLFLYEEMARQQEKDETVGKVKLAAEADWLIESISDAHYDAQELFEKYKKYMKDEL